MAENTKVNLIMLFEWGDHEKQLQTNLEKKFKNIFLTSMSHSLRTPLNSKL